MDERFNDYLDKHDRTNLSVHLHESDYADWAGHGQGLVYDAQHARNQLRRFSRCPHRLLAETMKPRTMSIHRDKNYTTGYLRLRETRQPNRPLKACPPNAKEPRAVIVVI